jgi:hypothetical protein
LYDTALIKQLDIEKSTLQSEQINYYKRAGKSETEANRLAQTDADAFYCETIARLIVDGTTRNSQNLTSEELQAARAFVSDYPKVMLILDDVSAELDALKTQTKSVQFNGASMKISNAYKSLILDILTTGRHKNAIICLFLHDIDIIQNMKSQIENVILLNATAANKIAMSRTFGPILRRKIESISPVLFVPEFEYYFLYLALSKGHACVGKADLFEGSCIKLSDLNKNYVEVYNNIIGINTLEDFSESESETDEKDNNKNNIFL